MFSGGRIHLHLDNTQGQGGPQRYKRIIGNTMKARALPQQKTEAWVSASALNMMTNLGMPVSVKI
jgi:hypothetical protein